MKVWQYIVNVQYKDHCVVQTHTGSVPSRGCDWVGRTIQYSSWSVIGRGPTTQAGGVFKLYISLKAFTWLVKMFAFFLCRMILFDEYYHLCITSVKYSVPMLICSPDYHPCLLAQNILLKRAQEFLWTKTKERTSLFITTGFNPKTQLKTNTVHFRAQVTPWLSFHWLAYWNPMVRSCFKSSIVLW